MAIEFGADNRPTSSVFGTGKGADQESRKLHASMAMRLGVRAGKCRSCGVAYVSGRGDLGRCTPCLTAAASAKINGAPVSKLDMAPDGSLTPSAPPTATDSRPSVAPPGSTERPLGADTLEDWTQVCRGSQP